MKYIRNFCIIAHIDHGKSTLSDRVIEFCKSVNFTKTNNKILDSMELEKEKGITIKSSCINLKYKSVDNIIYQFNLIDTPGHLDFTSEVGRTIYACEGALLVIDITKGVQSQTLSKYSLAFDNKLAIIPVFNKIDIFNINISQVIEDTKKFFNFTNYLLCSAKTGKGINLLLEYIIKYIPAPKGNILSPLQALIIDSWFDNYLGIICLIRIKNGIIKKFDKIQLMTSKNEYVVYKLGSFIPERKELKELKCGEIGWIIISEIKNLNKIPVGDTITLKDNAAKNVLPTFKTIQPKIYASVYSINNKKYENLKKALFKLNLNDAAFKYESHYSYTFGLGFKVGFLGLLHMEIIKERLKREYNLKIILTLPSVNYQILLKNNNIINIYSPAQLKNLSLIKEIREPIINCEILIPSVYLSKIMNLCLKKRGIQKLISYKDDKVYLTYELPLSEIIYNFSTQLQIVSNGYATFNYTFLKYKKNKIIILNLLINKKIIDEFKIFIHLDKSKQYALNLVDKLKEFIPRHQFAIIIQASINNKIIVSSIIKPFKKNVIAKCYGGDITRKKKLLIKQKKGKEKMKQFCNIKIPSQAYFNIFNCNKI